ncbi:MAG: RNA polymerase sigma factor [Candidatus Staskawiczbacteria bacterium]|nr:RNA polymerase sigma factor [Candidatus Staskawiczbacteria bacterium]
MDNLSEQFSQIYDQYIDKIYRFVYLKVDSQETAEDITSKVFLRGWEAFQSPNSEVKNPGAFLYQIARNAVVDHYRGKGRTKLVSVDASPEIVDPGTTAQDKAILSADINIVRKAIQKLENKDHQDIIIWHYLEDMPVASIAELLNKPEGTVRVMLHRGLKDLRNIIQES